MKLKDELNKTIGSTKHSKQRVWQQLEKPKRNNRLPIYISLAASVLACFILAIQFLPSNKQEHAITLENPPENLSDGLPFTVIHDQDGSTWNIEQEHVVLTAFTQEELDHWLHYFNMEAPGLSFDNHFVILTQFISDGCGLVVDKLQETNGSLSVTLALPPELRNNKELACTMQAMPNVQLLQLNKFGGAKALKQATFTGAGAHTTITINELNINDQFYNFGLAEDHVQIDKVTVNDIKGSHQIIFEDEASLQLISNSIFRAEQLPSIYNVTASNYQLIVHHESGEDLMMHILVDEEKNELLFVSEKNNSQAFMLAGEYAQKLLALLQS